MKLATIKYLYAELNARNFGGVLIQPVILVRRWRNALGQFVNSGNAPSRIEFNPEHLEGISHARAVIYHEMIHQYLHEFLDVEEKDDHGPIFWKHYTMFATKGIELGECL